MGYRHSSVMDHGYRASYYVADLDATGEGVLSIDIVVTTPATGSYWMAVDVSSHTTVLEVLKEDVTIGAAGTALTFFGRNRGPTHPNECACDIERTGTYTGGTALFSIVELRGQSGRHTLLKQSTSYQITVTSFGDNNRVSVMVWVWEGVGSEV